MVDVQNIFYQGNKKRLVPSFSEPDRLISYFNSVSTLMTNQLQKLGSQSMRDYTDLLVQPPVRYTRTRSSRSHSFTLVLFLLLWHATGRSYRVE